MQKEIPVDVNALKDPNIHKDFIRNISIRIPIIQEGDSIDKKSECIVESLNYSARNILPRKTRKVTWEIWKDDGELNNILQERSTLDRVSD